MENQTALFLGSISVAALDAAEEAILQPSLMPKEPSSTPGPTSLQRKHSSSKNSHRIAFKYCSSICTLTSLLKMPVKEQRPVQSWFCSIWKFIVQHWWPIKLRRLPKEKAKPSESYHHLLDDWAKVEYDPLFLDDPELRPGKHQSVICLASMISSLTPYTEASVLKRCLNDEFKRGPGTRIHPSLSLSKIRSLKRKIVEASIACHLEILTAAKAYTLFEKLILFSPGFVTSKNRKLVAAVCLLLMKKVDDDCDSCVDEGAFFAVCERLFAVGKNEVLAGEVEVFVQARFDLQLVEEEFVPHFERIINTLEFSNVQEYLGERMYGLWKRNCL